MQYFVGLTDGTPIDKRRYKTLKGACNHRHNCTPLGNPPMKIFRDTGDGIERYWGREKGHDEWSPLKPVKLDSPEFAASPVAQANTASWDEALTKPETHDAGGERIDPDTTPPRQ